MKVASRFGFQYNSVWHLLWIWLIAGNFYLRLPRDTWAECRGKKGHMKGSHPPHSGSWKSNHMGPTKPVALVSISHVPCAWRPSGWSPVPSELFFPNSIPGEETGKLRSSFSSRFTSEGGKNIMTEGVASEWNTIIYCSVAAKPAFRIQVSLRVPEYHILRDIVTWVNFLLQDCSLATHTITSRSSS